MKYHAKGENIHFSPGWKFSVFSRGERYEKSTAGVNFTSPTCNMSRDRKEKTRLFILPSFTKKNP